AIKRDIRTIIIDNINANDQFKETVKLAREMNKDCFITEKPFYVDLETAVERDSKREGKARVGEEVIKKFFKKLGSAQFKNYIPKTETVIKKSTLHQNIIPLIQNETKDKAIICDLDGSIALINNRSPYDTAKCLQDIPNFHIVELVKLYCNNGYKVIFCSGRDNSFRDLTKQWLDINVGIEYQLFMRPEKYLR